MKRHVLICILMLFLTVPVFSLSFDALPNYQDEGTKLYVRGTGRLQEHNYAEAVSDLRQAVRLRPDIPEAFHNLGFAFERTGDIRNAARAYERALQLKPNYPSALNNLGFLLAASETDINKSVALCQRAVELKPNSASFRDSLGWALYKADRHGEAMQHFMTAIKVDPGFFKSHFNMGLIEFTRKNYVAAGTHFRNCIQINPMYYKAYIPLADCFEKANDNNRALHYYRQALGRTPEGDQVRRHLERKVKQLTEQTKKQYFSSIGRRSGSSKIHEFMQRKSKSGELSARFNTGISQANVNSNFSPVSADSNSVNSVLTGSTSSNSRPFNDSSYSARPQVNVREQKQQYADYVAARNIRDTNTVSSSYFASSARVDSAPRQISIGQERELERRYSLSKSYLDRGLIREAEVELNSIINIAPETSMVSRQSRNMLLRVKKEIEGKDSKKALTHLDMGKDFFRSGQYEMAEAEFNKVLRLEPDNAEAHKDLALLYYNQERYDEAYEQSKRSIALNRTLKEAYVVLASLYAHKGRPDDALRTLKMIKQVSTRRDAVDELAEKMASSLNQGY